MLQSEQTLYDEGVSADPGAAFRVNAMRQVLVCLCVETQVSES